VGRADFGEPATVAAQKSGKDYRVSDVRQYRQGLSVGLDFAGRGNRGAGADLAGRARADDDSQCRPVACVILLDATRHRVFLADPVLHRLLHDRARAIGGRIYSEPMARLSFILFLVVAMPISIHHLFMDPEVGQGFKFLHSVFTAFVALPTLLTVFTICALVEIAGRIRGGKGVFGG
jgi:hypothetical protein